MKKQLVFTLLAAVLTFRVEALVEHNYVSGQNGTLKLILDLPDSRAVKDFFNSNKPDYAVELQYRFASVNGLSVQWDDLYYRLRRISRLEEISYFSEHIHKHQKMFKKAYLVKSLDQRDKIADLPKGRKVESTVVYAYLDEVVLGKGYYRIKYTVGKDFLGISMQNVTSLKRIIKIVNPNNLYFNFIFYKSNGILQAYLFGAYSLENKPIVEHVLKFPYSTLSKRVYTIFTALINGYQNISVNSNFPQELRE